MEVPLGVVGDVALDHPTATLRLATACRRGHRGRRGRSLRRLGSGGGRDRSRNVGRRCRVRRPRGGDVGGVGGGGSRGGLAGRGRSGVAALRARSGARKRGGRAGSSEALEVVIPDIRPLDVVVDARDRHQFRSRRDRGAAAGYGELTV